MHVPVSKLNIQEGLCRYPEFSMQISPLQNSAMRTLPSLVLLDFQLHLMYSLRFSLPVPQSENSLKAVNCSNHRVTSFVSCLSGISVLHCLMSKVLKYILMYFVCFFLVVSGGRINRQNLLLHPDWKKNYFSGILDTPGGPKWLRIFSAPQGVPFPIPDIMVWKVRNMPFEVFFPKVFNLNLRNIASGPGLT